MSVNKKSLLIVVSGPSGVGKDTIRNELVKKIGISKSVSATTRAMGPNEQEGVDYFYLTEEEFDRKLQQNEILEYDMYNSHRYGTLWETVRNYVSQGRNIVFALTIPGALAIKKAYPDDSVAVFILPPSIEELERRLKGREREDESVIKQRIEIAIETEIAHAGEFDYRVVNDDLDKAVEELCEIIKKEKELRGDSL